jgi:DNA-directed RNA polymerase specialized sigma24 family protein
MRSCTVDGKRLFLVVRFGSLRLSWGMARPVRLDENRPVSSLAGFETFVAAHERRLRQGLTAAVGAEHGPEAAADALVYAWEHWDRVVGMANPVGYLFVVGRDRHRRRFRSRFTRPVFDVGPDRPDPWCEPALAAQMARLSERERVVVMLVNGFEWSLAEVAELMGVSKSTVQTHAERGMAKLRAGMGVTA